MQRSIDLALKLNGIGVANHVFELSLSFGKSALAAKIGHMRMPRNYLAAAGKITGTIRSSKKGFGKMFAGFCVKMPIGFGRK